MKKLMMLVIVLTLAAVPFVVTACGDEEPAPAETTEASEEPAEQATDEATDAALPDIVETAIEAGDFTTLVAALEEAGLVETLKGDGPFTVFAPTDAAFDMLPEGTLDALLEDPTAQLADVLTYHVVPGKVLSSDLADGMTAITAQGSALAITVTEDGTVMVGGATVTTADIEASNGVIHVVDQVLIPPPQGGT